MGRNLPTRITKLVTNLLSQWFTSKSIEISFCSCLCVLICFFFFVSTNCSNRPPCTSNGSVHLIASHSDTWEGRHSATIGRGVRKKSTSWWSWLCRCTRCAKLLPYTLHVRTILHCFCSLPTTSATGRRGSCTLVWFALFLRFNLHAH